MIDIQLLEDKLDVSRCVEMVSAPETGGINVFIGTVRNHTKGKRVLRLEFEAYEPMAISEMQKIARRAMENYDVQRMVIHHRVGSLAIGEIPVIIAVGAAHREAAFQACKFAIDTLKETVPIWKKEIFEDGEVWVAAHP
ncbi:MAG: molybdenum cofactor biosynthesis protein MoaE [Saprospiraceae bacterium]|nr:molybdenum cofactor biosynthesis protein MoaE [Saprospirales bacterium]